MRQAIVAGVTVPLLMFVVSMLLTLCWLLVAPSLQGALKVGLPVPDLERRHPWQPGVVGAWS